MITVFYFARLKESLSYSTEEMELPAEQLTIGMLMSQLAARGGKWAEVFSGKQPVRAAINHALVENFAIINDGDEVAFFPPVTGG